MGQIDQYCGRKIKFKEVQNLTLKEINEKVLMQKQKTMKEEKKRNNLMSRSRQRISTGYIRKETQKKS